MTKTVYENLPKKKKSKYICDLQMYFIAKHWKNWLESEAEPKYCTDKQNNLVHCEDCHEECKDSSTSSE